MLGPDGPESEICVAYVPHRVGRSAVTKGAGARATMVFKLVESAQARRRAVNGAHLVPLVRAGARFERGLLIQRAETLAARGGRHNERL
jgi:hypothetical protein